MKKYNIKKLLKKYNKILSEKYNGGYKLLDLDYDSIVGNINAIETLEYSYWSDCSNEYLECEYIKKYLYFNYIKDDLKDFLEVEE